ncbi:unnamed protein product [Schistocephalus solidus]|uniref:CID domain-containing protein n=1 Tax=Schistocephalus solidus TaxID=70667 RepID=A0A183TLV1_SCHSO|nr:unnamed protein product [Schistocephalus solidus]
MPEQADTMSKLWLAAFKSAAEPAAQLALLYVVNEIILKCASYGAPEVKAHFQEPLLEAIRYLRPGLLIKKVKKLVTMWADQKVYEPKLMHQLLRSIRMLPAPLSISLALSLFLSLSFFLFFLPSHRIRYFAFLFFLHLIWIIVNLDQKTGVLKENSTEQEDAVSIKDFVPEKFLEQLRKLKNIEEVSPSVTESDLTPACLKFPIDVVLGRVKSKEEGRSLSCQISTCSDRLASLLKGLEKKLAAQEEVFDILGKAELFYSIQQKEAAIVANRRKIRQKSGDSEDDNGDGDARQPFDLTAVATFPFRELIVVDSNGDADYRPISQEAVAHNTVFGLPGSGDFDGRQVEVKPCRTVDVSDRNGVVDSSPQPPVIEDNMDVSDDEVKEEPTLDNAPPAPPPPPPPPVVQSALTDTGDYDWRQTKPTLPKVEEPLPLGSEDADLRLLSHPATHVSRFAFSARKQGSLAVSVNTYIDQT